MENIENYFYDKNNKAYKKTIKIFENILENFGEYEEEFIFNNKHCIYENENFLEEFVPNKIEKFCYGFNIIEEEVKNNKYDISRHSDICLGIIMNCDCTIKIKFGGSLLWNNLNVKKNKIFYFDNPIFLIKCCYNIFSIYIEPIDSNNEIELKIKLIHLYLANEERKFIAQNNIKLNNCLYHNSVIISINKDINNLYNNFSNYDFSFFYPNSEKVYLNKSKQRNIKRTEKYKFELIEKCWHPKRLQNWCLSLDELKLIE